VLSLSRADGPDVRWGKRRDRVGDEDGWRGHWTPSPAVPAQDARPRHGPDVIAGISRNATYAAHAGKGRARNHTPARAVAVLHQDPRGAGARRPDIARGDGRDRTQESPVADFGAGGHAPSRAVPMLDQCSDGVPAA